jgi:hypothetical protein
LGQLYSHSKTEFYIMKNDEKKVLEKPSKSHRGAYVEYIVKTSTLDGRVVHKTWLASKMGLHRKTLDLWFAKADLEVSKVREIGRIIRHDFSKDYPELREELAWTASDELSLSLNPTEFPEILNRCKSERDRYKDLYIGMLEKFNSLQEDYYNLKLAKGQ